jgi:electron transport complex protein RnfD
MNKLLVVSIPPHWHSGDSIPKKMYGVLLALVPASLVSLYVFGMGALMVTMVSVVSCVLLEWLIQKFVLKVPPTISDGSAALTGVLLAFNLPSNLPVWMVVFGALVAIGIGKQTFGGLGCNPFNPALVGRVFLLVSFPAQMTSWPLPFQRGYTDAVTGATPLALIHDKPEALPDIKSMFLGTIGGSLGEVSALALLIGGIYLLIRRIISWHIPLTLLVTVFVLSSLLALFKPGMFGFTPYEIDWMNAVAFGLFQVVSGGLFRGAFFLATDYVTSPMLSKGQVIYAVCIGILTVLIRLYGDYPEGLSFAILFMNALTPLINTLVKPKPFGEVRR